MKHEIVRIENNLLERQRKIRVWGGDMVVTLSIFLGLFFLLALGKIYHKLWWTPARIQYLMASRGIRGPSYKFVQGNAKEMWIMREEAVSKPMTLSHNIFPKVQPSFHSWSKMYGKNFLQWLGTRPQFIISEPELIKEVLNNKNKAYPKSPAEDFLKKLLGDGLATTEGEKWSKLRKLANHSFHAESLKGMVPAMTSSVEIMLERWKHYEGKEIEVFEEFRVLTSEVISKTAFGSSYLEGKKIFDMLRRLTVIAVENIFRVRLPIISKLFKTKDEIESEMLEKEIENTIKEMVKKRENKAMTGEEDRYGSDFLGGLIKAHHDASETQRISMEDVIDECKTFYFAGHETLNSLLAWTVFLLAIHTDWQEEVRKEVLNLFGQQNPNSEIIAKLRTMSLVINESLRLYTPVLGFSRKTERELRLGNLIIPADMEILISNLALHHDAQIWGEDVHQFKPERFSEGFAKATNNNPAAFFPFGMGPRICVGMNFALIEAKIALSMILQRYSFTLSPAYVHSPYQLITLHAQQGIQVILQPL
ncbi:Cytochrome P450, E-class, group I [Parasponia andersonii]|uniref:Cytochrome P450, E-class, group I n=1 Tax=Parasponia andersonii TaxID=3476 RepID=A0A2P5E2K8_PARAD|nr:Cytochrome P450, E-class, group I [Parasponia andersonii]